MNLPSLSDPFLAFGLGVPELLIIFAALLLLFGARKLPDLARGLGQSIKEFKKASKELDNDDDNKDDAKEAKKIEQPKKDDNSQN